MKWLVALISVVAIGEAEAGMLDVVSGGPGGLEASLARIEPAVGVCFATGRSRSAVKVRITVAAGGQVVAASPVSRGAVAQCVAGVLAVQSVSGARRNYTAVISADPGGGSAAKLRAAIDALRPGIDRCLERVAGGKALRGRLAVRFTIAPSGRVSGSAIVEDSVGKGAARDCVTRAIRRARLPSPPGRRSLEYTLPIAVNIAGRSGQGAPAVAGPALRPQKDGPVPAAAITAVMRKKQPAFTACYDRVARKRRDLRGHVTLRFTIRDSGRVTNAKVRESSLKNPAVETCMVKVARGLRFSAEAGRAPTRVFYPFSFSPK